MGRGGVSRVAGVGVVVVRLFFFISFLLFYGAEGERRRLEGTSDERGGRWL